MNPLGSARVIVTRRGGYPIYVFKPIASTGLGIQSPYNLNFYKNLNIVTFIDISLRRTIRTFHFSG